MPSTPSSPTTPSPTTPPPPSEEPPPPPTEKPPLPPPEEPKPPADEKLTPGERYEHKDADGRVDFTITLVQVEADIACTAAGTVPAENGHLIGLHVEIVDPTPPATGEPPSISAADFHFVGADKVVTADVDTDSSAACLQNGWPAGQPRPDTPVAGTLVLDVPAVTGTVVYRPKSWPAGLRWDF
jgi:hypothetical protein